MKKAIFILAALFIVLVGLTDDPPHIPPTVKLQAPNNPAWWWEADSTRLHLYMGAYGWLTLTDSAEVWSKFFPYRNAKDTAITNWPIVSPKFIGDTVQINSQLVWDNDTIYKDSIVYAENAIDSIRFRYINGAWSDWFKNATPIDLTLKTDSVTATLPIVSTKTSNRVYNISINPATTTTHGSMSAADKAKLDSLHNIAALAGDSALFVVVDSTETISSEIRLGYLYNSRAITDIRSIANTGWHVPTREDWTVLATGTPTPPVSTYVGLGEFKDTSYWTTPNIGALNSYGMKIRGGGIRSSSDGLFSGITTGTYYAYEDFATEGIFFTYSTVDAYSVTFGDLNAGVSVRLIKDATSLSDGQNGEYIGNDGTVYPTVCIDTQEWLLYNLTETKYQDGSLIPEVTDNTAWTLLSDGGRCSYGNDTSNADTTIISIVVNTTNVHLGDTLAINTTNLASKDTLINYWNKQEITTADTTRWGEPEIDPIFAADSANIVHFNELDYFTNADETDQIYAADSAYIKSHVRNDLDLDPTNEIQRLDEILNPNASKAFSLGGNTITWNFTNPIGGMLFNMTGGWSGHVLEIADTSPVPNGSAGDHLMHMETSRVNVVPAHFVNNAVGGEALRVEGETNITGDVNVTGIIDATTLKKTGGLSTEFLKADGSVDNNTYTTTASVANMVTETTPNAASTSIMVSDGSTDRKIKESLAKVTADGSVNIPTGQTYQVNSTQISSANLSNNSDLAKLNSSPVFTGTIQATTAKLTNLTDGYLPYHISDASGLGNSYLSTDGANLAYGSSTSKIFFRNTGTNFSINRNPSTGTISDNTISAFQFSVSGAGASGFSRMQHYLETGTPTSAFIQFMGTGKILVGTTTDNTIDLLQVSGSVTATGYKLSGVSTFLDWTRTGYAGTSGQILKSQGISMTPIWWTPNYLTSETPQTLSVSSIGTYAKVHLSGADSITFKSGAGITLSTSNDTITVTGPTVRTETPYSATANTSYTHDVSTYINSKVSTNTAISITLSNLGEGQTGNIEINYTGAAVVTFIVDSSYTLDVSPNILNAITNAYTNTILSKSSGHYITSYYRSGNNVYINGR